MGFKGKREDSFEIIDDLKSVAADAYSIRDEIGAKSANVYLYEKDGDNEPVWQQVLPTPSIRDLSFKQDLMEGGIVERGDLRLGAIPIANYSEEDLRTSGTDRDIRKFWVLQEPGGPTKAYTTVHISRRLLNYIVHIRRFDAINEDDLVVPPVSVPV